MISRNSIVTPDDSARVSSDALDRLADEELLKRFRAGSHEEANRAFAQIVRRHQAVVLGVCRRVLNDEHEAEDVFQATFLLLARKSKQVRDPRLLSAWLHRVAFRMCLRLQDRRRQQPELLESVESLAQRERTLQAEAAREACQAIDEELERLPDQQRSFLILCALEGMSYGQVARRLGVTRNQVKWGLARARTTLRLRLARRGLAYSGCMLAALTTHKSACAAPTALSISTAELATRFVYYPTTLSVASKPILIAYEGLHVMLLTKLKTALLVTVAVSTLGVGSFITFASAASPSHLAGSPAARYAQDEDRAREEAQARAERARAEAERQRALAEEQRQRAEDQLRKAKEQFNRQREMQEQAVQQQALRAQKEAQAAQEQMRRDLDAQRKMMEEKLRLAEADLQRMRDQVVATQQEAEAMRRRTQDLAKEADEARSRGDENAIREYQERRAVAEEEKDLATMAQAKTLQKMRELEAMVHALAQERQQLMEEFDRSELNRRREMERDVDMLNRRREEEMARAQEIHQRAVEVSQQNRGQLHEIMTHFEAITNEQRARTEELSDQVREIRNIQEKILMELRRLREGSGEGRNERRNEERRNEERRSEQRRSEEVSAAEVNRIENERRDRQRDLEMRAMAEFKEAQARLEKMRADEVRQLDRQELQQDQLQRAQIEELMEMIEILQAEGDSEPNRERIAQLKKIIAALKAKMGESAKNNNVNRNSNRNADEASIQLKRKVQAMTEQLDRLEAEKSEVEAMLKKTVVELEKQGGESRKRQ